MSNTDRMRRKAARHETVLLLGLVVDEQIDIVCQVHEVKETEHTGSRTIDGNSPCEELLLA